MSDVILEMKHITKAFSGVKALDNVNLQVKKAKFMRYVVRTEPVNRL